MNRTELISAVAEKSGLKKNDAANAVSAITEVIAEAMKEGEKVSIPGFGTFEVTERAGREGRNPRTGEAITIAASKSVKFKGGKALKDAVNA